MMRREVVKIKKKRLVGRKDGKEGGVGLSVTHQGTDTLTDDWVKTGANVKML